MDRARIEGFLETFVGFASGATTIGLLAIADRSGLTTYLGETGGGTADDIAGGTGLQLRYVEEIMAGLAAAGVVGYDSETKRFDLPPEHALFIADETSPYYMAGFLDILPAALANLDGIAHAAVHGGGVGFEEFGPDLVAGIDRGNSPSQRAFLISRWLPGIPGLIERLESGIRVAEIGCGSGTAALLIAEAFPNSKVSGFDVSPESIEAARGRGAHLDNLEFHVSRVEDIPIDPGFDLITSFDVIHDLATPLDGLRRVRQALAPDGHFLMMEPNASSDLAENLTPRGAMLYGISVLHCMTQSLARGGVGLGAAWGGQRARALAEEAGFGSFQPVDGISNRFSAFYLLRH
jgi:SAM-dependent methyltransferase